jgi:hypothetical protein
MIVEEKKMFCHSLRAEKVVGLRVDSTSSSSGFSTQGCTDWKMGHISFVGC